MEKLISSLAYAFRKHIFLFILFLSLSFSRWTTTKSICWTT